VKLSLCLISHHAANVDGVVKVYVYTFFISYLDKHRSVASRPSCFIVRTFARKNGWTSRASLNENIVAPA